MDKPTVSYIRLIVDRNLLKSFKSACVMAEKTMTEVLEEFMKVFLKKNENKS